jgi:hypothetical protein
MTPMQPVRGGAAQASSTASPEDRRSPPCIVPWRPHRPEHNPGGEGLRRQARTSAYAAEYLEGAVEGTYGFLFLDEGGVLVRQSGPMNIAGQMTSLMTTDVRGEPPYAHRLLHDLMILPPGAD